MVPFPPTFYINEKHRKDRIRHIKKEFANWPVPLHRVEAVKLSPGWKGCTQSHRKIVQMAHDRDYPWVLCLEDDCKLEKDALERFQKVIEFLWSNKDWDIFNGGVSFVGGEFKIIEEKIPILQYSGTGTQFILLHKRSFAKILADLSPTDPIVSIDNYYKDNFPPRYFLTYPHIATQINGMSSILGVIRDVQKNFRATNNLIRKKFNLLRKTIKANKMKKSKESKRNISRKHPKGEKQKIN
jgi:GR25 family glycosyltransferase involved in LPS biosynthesis